MKTTPCKIPFSGYFYIDPPGSGKIVKGISPKIQKEIREQILLERRQDMVNQLSAQSENGGQRQRGRPRKNNGKTKTSGTVKQDNAPKGGQNKRMQTARKTTSKSAAKVVTRSSSQRYNLRSKKSTPLKDDRSIIVVEAVKSGDNSDTSGDSSN